MNKLNKNMEMWEQLPKDQRVRLMILLDKKEKNSLTKEEVQEYKSILKKALSLSCNRWGV